MPLPRNSPDTDWQQLLASLESRIERAVRTYVKAERLTADDLARGYAEMYRLIEGGEPDYDIPGVAVAYALTYMPRRVVAVLGALAMTSQVSVPDRVLDIGSGTGATLLALELWKPGCQIEVTAVEPSAAMQRFANVLASDSTVVQRHFSAGIEELAEGSLGLVSGSLDLVVMSACLQYGSCDLGAIARTVGTLVRQGSPIVAIEPEAKLPELKRLSHALVNRGYDPRIACCHDLPLQVREGATLARLSGLVKSVYPEIIRSQFCDERTLGLLGRHGPFPVKTWNPSRTEGVLVCRGGPVNRPVSRPLPARAHTESRARLHSAPSLSLIACREGSDVRVTVKQRAYVRISADGVVLFNGVIDRVGLIRGVAHGRQRIVAEVVKSGRVIAATTVE